MKITQVIYPGTIGLSVQEFEDLERQILKDGLLRDPVFSQSVYELVRTRMQELARTTR